MARSNDDRGQENAGDARLDPYAPPVETAKAERLYPVTTPFQETRTLHKVAGYLFALFVVFPGMMLANFFPDWNALSPMGWIAIATIGAALSGALFVHGRAPHHVGVAGGMLCAPGALTAIVWWTSGRSSVLRIEVAIAFLIGALPGAFIYMWLFKRAVPAEGDPRSP